MIDQVVQVNHADHDVAAPVYDRQNHEGLAPLGHYIHVMASALIETGSRMDDFIFQEFKGTGNMEMVLDRKAAELRIWPAINIAASGTRREELLLHPDTLEHCHFLRRALAGIKVEEATETAIARLSKTKTNEEFFDLLKL